MKLFLDDVRNPQDCLGYMHTRIGAENPIYNEEWVVVRDYNRFCNELETFSDIITHVSFDHDLATEHYAPEDHWDSYESYYAWKSKQKWTQGTGYDCAVFMKEYYSTNGLELPRIFIHSMNPPGCEAIASVFE